MQLKEDKGLRILTPDSEDNVITDVETETIRSKIVYLGKNDSIDNYKEIDKNTPVSYEDDKTTNEDLLSDEQLQQIAEVYS